MLLAQLILFILSLAVLLVSANLFVGSAAKVAYLIKISPLIIGVTIMGFGTSLPELVVSIYGSLRKSSGLVAGNLVGSNIANIGLILGVSFLLGKIRLGTTKTPKNTILHLFVTLIFLVLLAYGFLNLTLGLIFLVGAGIVLFWEIRAGKKGAEAEDFRLFKTHPQVKMGVERALLLVLLGLAGTSLGGKILVDSSLNIVRFLGISPSIIGLTAVAVGTSLPELTTNIIGFLKVRTNLFWGIFWEPTLLISCLLGEWPAFFLLFILQI